MFVWVLDTLLVMRFIFQYVSIDESIKEVKHLSHRKTSQASHIPTKLIKGSICLFFVQQL